MTTAISADIKELDGEGIALVRSKGWTHEGVHAVRYYVVHELGGTWARQSVYATRDGRGKRFKRPSYMYRFGERLTRTVEKLPNQPHPDGVCSGCTQRWRIAHGLSADTSDLQDLPK